jgi:branched-chain amino acid transport system permease protein
MNIPQLLFNGLIVGSFYALVAIGFVLIYRVSGVFNFAQPALMLLGALIFAKFNHHSSWKGFLIAVLISALLTAAISCILYVTLIAPLVSRPHFVQMMATFGISIALLDGLLMEFGSSPRPVVLPVQRHNFRLPFGIGTNNVDCAIFLASSVLVLGMIWVASGSRLGLRIQAIAEDVALASYVGIRGPVILASTWAVAGAIAALGGVAYGARVEIDPSMVDIGLAVFPAAMIGGMDSPGGAIIGGVGLALLQGIAVTLFGASASLPIGYAALLLLFVFKPQGLFGLRPVERV